MVARKMPVMPSLVPRVHPLGRAILLLGIASSGLAGRRFAIGGRRVQTLRFGKLALLVSYVAPEDYGADVVAHKRGNLAWLAAEASLLERSVVRAAPHATILPAPLLCVFATSAALELHARHRYLRWTRSLSRLAAASEFALTAFVGPHDPPGATPYPLRVTARVARSSRPPQLTGEPAVAAFLARAWRETAALALAVRRIASGKRERERLGLALLTAAENEQRLRALVANLSGDGAPLGVTLYLDGPHAPFTFASAA